MIRKKLLKQYLKYFQDKIVERNIVLPADVKRDFVKVKTYTDRDVVSPSECGLIEDILLYLLNDLDGFDLFEENEKLYSEIVMFVMRDISDGSDSSEATRIR